MVAGRFGHGGGRVKEDLCTSGWSVVGFWKTFNEVGLVTALGFNERRAGIHDRVLQLFPEVRTVFPGWGRCVIVVMEGEILWWARQDGLESGSTAGAIDV